MLFAGSMAVVLVGYPQVLLSILAEELLPCTKQFVGCALVFILIATLGPCSGVLQMTGNERKITCIAKLHWGLCWCCCLLCGAAGW